MDFSVHFHILISCIHFSHISTHSFNGQLLAFFLNISFTLPLPLGFQIRRIFGHCITSLKLVLHPWSMSMKHSLLVALGLVYIFKNTSLLLVDLILMYLLPYSMTNYLPLGLTLTSFCYQCTRDQEWLDYPHVCNHHKTLEVEIGCIKIHSMHVICYSLMLTSFNKKKCCIFPSLEYMCEHRGNMYSIRGNGEGV